MAFPTIPTGGRVVTGVQADTSGTRTFPSLSGLTKNSGDLLVAIIVCYQSSLTSNIFSSWGAGFGEVRDIGVASQHCIGVATKISDGTETGTFTVAQAGTVTGHAAFILLSIPGAHASTPVEVTAALATGTSAAADPAALDPSGWAAEDTLWIAVAGSGETSGTGSYTGTASAPTNYTDYAETAISADAVGGVQAAVAFRQLNASSENVGTFSVDTSNARNCAFVIAVRPAPATTTFTPNPVVFDFNPVAPVVVSENPYVDVVLGYTPTAYWPLGEGAGTTAEDVAGTLDGTYQATPTLAQAGGAPGLSVALSGDDWISVPDNAVVDFTSPFSIMMWVKSDGSLNSLDNALWGKGTGGVPYLFVTGTSQTPAGRVTLAKSDAADNVQTGALITDTAWHHIVVVWTQSSIGKIYVDGVDEGGSPSYNAFNSNAVAAGIGSKTGASLEAGWGGNIQHVAIFDYALNQTEVSDLYDSAFPAAGTTFTPAPVVFDVNPVAPALVTSLALAPAAVAIDVNPVAPTLGLSLALAPSAVAIDVNPVAPAIALGALELTPAAVAIDVNPVAPMLATTLALAPAPVAFDMNPVAPTVDLALAIAPAPVAFDLNPVAPSIVLGDLTLAPAPVAIPVALPAVVVSVGGILTLAPDPVVFDLNPVAPTLGLVLALTPPAVAFDVNPVAPALAHVLALAPASVSIPLALPAVVVDVESGATTLAPNPVVFALSPVAPVLGLALGLTPSPVAIDLNPVAPTLGLVLSLAPSPVQIVSSVPAPTLVSTLSLAPAPVAVSVALPNSILRFDWVLSPDPVVFSLSPVSPSVVVDLRIAADALNMLKKNRSRWPWDRGGFPRR